MDTTTSVVTRVVGWIQKCQKLSKVGFLNIVEDASSPPYQVVVDNDLWSEGFTAQAYVEVKGILKPKMNSNNNDERSFEILASEIKILSLAEKGFSYLVPPNSGLDVQLDRRHLFMRTPEVALIVKMRAKLLTAIRKHFEETECTEIVPPCFVGNQCEGGSTLFSVDHVGTPAYLTQSSQFYLELAIPSVGDCYCIYPSFRAEKSHTRRHLTEFLHAEAEWKNVNNMETHVSKLHEMLRNILGWISEDKESRDIIKKLGCEDHFVKCCDLLKNPTTMTHAEAIKYCRDNNIYKEEETKTHFDDKDDIPESQERRMIDQIGKLVYLVKFPKEFKSFYMKECEDTPGYVEGCDVEVPGVGEIIGSGIRVSDPKELSARIIEQGLNPAEYLEYVDLRLYGHGKTSGMGLGVDRMLTWILNRQSIREVVTFPRYAGRLFP